MLKRLFILLLVVIALSGAGDWLITTWAEGAMERHLTNEVGGSAHVEIDSWPVITRALVSENVDQIGIDLRRIGIEGVDVEFMRIELNGLEVSQARIFQRQLDDVQMKHGEVSAVMSLADIASVAGVPSESVTGAGELSVVDGRLVMNGQDVAAFPADIFPCPVADATINGDEIEIGCSIDSVPSIVLRNLPR